MADNTTLNAGTGGDVIATDDIAGVKHQLVKVEFGADGAATLVTATTPLPTQISDGTDTALVSAGGALLVDGSGVTQPISNAGITTIAGAVAGTEMQVDVLTMPSTAVTNAGTFATQESGAALTALQLIDNPVAVLGTATYAEATTSGFIAGAVRRDADTSAVGTDNEIAPLIVDANGYLKVEIFDGGGSHTVDGTVAVTGVSTFAEQQTQTTALQLIDDSVATLGTTTYAEATTKGLIVGALRRDADTTAVGTDNEVAPLQVDANGRLKVEAFSGETLPVSGTVTVAGGAAHASPVSGNPNLVAGRASAAIPTDVGADGDAASLWTNRNGAQVVLQAPHIGLNSDPWNLVNIGVQYTTAQTSAVVLAGGASEKIVITRVQMQAYGTTAGTAILYFGTGAYSRGTSRSVFDGEFAPSTTLKPGVVLQGPFIAGTNGDDILFTSVGNLSITLSIWYYVVT